MPAGVADQVATTPTEIVEHVDIDSTDAPCLALVLSAISLVPPGETIDSFDDWRAAYVNLEGPFALSEVEAVDVLTMWDVKRATVGRWSGYEWHSLAKGTFCGRKVYVMHYRKKVKLQ